MDQRRAMRGRTGRWAVLGTTGFATAVTLLMVLAPVSQGATVRPLTVLHPAFKHTAFAPNSYVDLYGCKQTASTQLGTWNASSGQTTGKDSSSARTCKSSTAGVGSSSSGYASDGIELAIPFKVNSNGNHSVMEKWTFTLASTFSFFNLSCPAKNINYHPGLNQYSYAYCEGAAQVSLYLDSQVVDLNNNSWYSYNYSYLDVSVGNGWENYTDCYNYGTATCYNFTGNPSLYNYGYNEAGGAAFTGNGATQILLWNNATNMVSSHRYAIVIYLTVQSSSYAEFASLLGPYAAIASASVNMATHHNGAVLHSVVIH